jgi:hypothetical protein
VSNHSYRESGYLVEDVWAYMRMGCTIVQPRSIFRILEDTA